MLQTTQYNPSSCPSRFFGPQGLGRSLRPISQLFPCSTATDSHKSLQERNTRPRGLHRIAQRRQWSQNDVRSHRTRGRSSRTRRRERRGRSYTKIEAVCRRHHSLVLGAPLVLSIRLYSYHLHGSDGIPGHRVIQHPTISRRQTQPCGDTHVAKGTLDTRRGEFRRIARQTNF